MDTAKFERIKNSLFKKAFKLSNNFGCEVAVFIFDTEDQLYEISTRGPEPVIERWKNTNPVESFVCEEINNADEDTVNVEHTSASGTITVDNKPLELKKQNEESHETDFSATYVDDDELKQETQPRRPTNHTRSISKTEFSVCVTPKLKRIKISPCSNNDEPLISAEESSIKYSRF